MKRDLAPAEAFDEKLAELTEEYFRVKRRLLAYGDEAITGTVCDALSGVMTEQLWEGLVQMAAHDPATAGAALAKLVENVLRNAAEIDALKETEQLEQQYKQSQDEARIERVAWHRAMH